MQCTHPDLAMHQLHTTPTPPHSQCRYREAVYSFQAAVQVQAADPLAHFRIGNALFALKKYADARKVRGVEGRAGGNWRLGACLVFDGEVASLGGELVCRPAALTSAAHACASQAIAMAMAIAHVARLQPTFTAPNALAGVRPRAQVLQARRGRRAAAQGGPLRCKQCNGCSS